MGYIRIFNSWVDAYSYEGVPQGEGPKLTGVPFNDAYRYMDWLLTVPLLLIEILLVLNPISMPDTSNWDPAKNPRKSSLVASSERRESRRLELRSASASPSPRFDLSD